MKWTLLKVGNRRTITKFCYLPCKADSEIRWLEKVTIQQEYVSFNYPQVLLAKNKEGSFWINLNFLNNE